MGSSAMFNARPGLPTMMRGPAVAFAADNEGGAEGEKAADDKAADKAAETIDPAKYQGLAAAHERLKKDSAADRAALKALNDWKAEIEAKQAEAEEAKAREAGDFDTVKKQLEDRYSKEVTKRDEAIGKYRTQVEKLVIDAGLSQAIAAAGVGPEFQPAVSALLRQGVEIKDDDEGNPVAYRGGVPLAEYVKLWAESEQGKAFVRINNSGGDAKGGQGRASGAKTITRADFMKLGPAEQMKASRELQIVD
jgi:hypothetical protein